MDAAIARTAPQIGLVVHALERTGAPIAALRLADILARRHGLDFSVFAKEGGRLRDMAAAIGPVRVTQSGPHRPHIGYRDALHRAVTALSAAPPDALYVHSLACAEWCEAAELLDIPVVLHVHELAPLMAELTRAGRIPQAFSPKLSGLVGPSEQNLRDARRRLKSTSTPELIVPSVIDVNALREAAALAPPAARNGLGDALDWNSAPFAMCGAPTHDKGVDLFIAAARQRPDQPFVWIGALQEGLDDHPAVAAALAERPPNLYATGRTSRVAAALARSRALLLSSRADSNPLVLAEAMALGVPVAAHARALGATELVERFGRLLDGRPDAAGLLEVVDDADGLARMTAGLTEPKTLAAMDKQLGAENALADLAKMLRGAAAR